VRALMLLLVLALGGCAGAEALAPNVAPLNAAPAAAGEWKIDRRADRIADRPQYSAVLITRSQNASVTASSPSLPQYASLQLMCFDNAPIVRFHFNAGVGSDRNSRLAYRFDDKPGQDANARILQDFRTIVIEDMSDVVRFTDDLRRSSRLLVQVMSLTRGQSSAQFNVTGASAAIEAAFSGCPLAAPQRARRSQHKDRPRRRPGVIEHVSKSMSARSI